MRLLFTFSLLLPILAACGGTDSGGEIDDSDSRIVGSSSNQTVWRTKNFSFFGGVDFIFLNDIDETLLAEEPSVLIDASVYYSIATLFSYTESGDIDSYNLSSQFFEGTSQYSYVVDEIGLQSAEIFTTQMEVDGGETLLIDREYVWEPESNLPESYSYSWQLFDDFGAEILLHEFETAFEANTAGLMQQETIDFADDRETDVYEYLYDSNGNLSETRRYLGSIAIENLVSVENHFYDEYGRPSYNTTSSVDDNDRNSLDIYLYFEEQDKSTTLVLRDVSEQDYQDGVIERADLLIVEYESADSCGLFTSGIARARPDNVPDCKLNESLPSTTELPEI